MDIIKLTRELGKEIQKNDKYLNLKIASEINDQDENLQNLIKEFNLKKLAVNNELSKENRNDKKIKTLNAELTSCYEKLMSTENMKNFKLAKLEFDSLMNRVIAIIMKSAQGEDPNTVDFNDSECTGSCSSCSGCH